MEPRRLKCDSALCKGEVKPITNQGQCMSCLGLVAQPLSGFGPKCKSCGVDLILGMALCSNGHDLEGEQSETLEQIAFMQERGITAGFHRLLQFCGEPICSHELTRRDIASIAIYIGRYYNKALGKNAGGKQKRNTAMSDQIAGEMMKKVLLPKGFKPNKGNTDDFMRELCKFAERMVPVYRNRADDKALNVDMGKNWVLQRIGGTPVKGFNINEKKLSGTMHFIRQTYGAAESMNEEDAITFFKSKGVLVAKGVKLQGIENVRKGGEEEGEGQGESSSSGDEEEEDEPKPKKSKKSQKK